MNFMKHKSAWWEKGNAIPEYAIIMSAVALAAIGGLSLVGLNTVGGYQYITNSMELTPTPVSEIVANPTPIQQPAPQPTDSVSDRERTDDGIDRDLDNTNFFFDNFDDNDSDDWAVSRGKDWYVENGRYCTGTQAGEHRSFAGDPTWSDYTVTIQAELMQSKGYGIYFRVESINPLNAYVFQYDYGLRAFVYRKVIKGREKSPFAVMRIPSGYSWYNQPRSISIQIKGDTFTAFVDGQQVLQAADPDYKTGQIGLRTWATSETCFDDVTILPLN